MKFYKLIKGEEYSDRFQTGDIYKSNDSNWSLFNNTIQDLVDDYPQDWKEVSELEYLEQETDNTMTKEERIKRLEKELDSQFKLLNELKKEVEQPEFQVGKWYKGISKRGNEFLAKYTPNETSDFTIGFWKGCWSDNPHGMVDKEQVKTIRKATEDEVKEALVKEAKKRGLHEGNKISTPKNGHEYMLSDGAYDYKYYENTDELYCHGILIYENSNWGEPHKNKIRDYVVEDLGEGKKIGCVTVSDEFLDIVKELTKEHDIKIELEGTDVTDDIINLNL